MKKGAIELSIGTIVVVVLAMTMLILGVVFVRNIMCGAIGLTGDINNQVRGEINKLFGATGDEVVCVGSGEQAVTLLPGKTNIIYCAVNAQKSATYNFELNKISATVSTEEKLRSWISGEDSLSIDVAPGDKLPKKVLRLTIPNNAPEESIVITFKIKKGNELISTQQLDFEVKRLSGFSSAIC